MVIVPLQKLSLAVRESVLLSDLRQENTVVTFSLGINKYCHSRAQSQGGVSPGPSEEQVCIWE